MPQAKIEKVRGYIQAITDKSGGAVKVDGEFYDYDKSLPSDKRPTKDDYGREVTLTLQDGKVIDITFEDGEETPAKDTASDELDVLLKDVKVDITVERRVNLYLQCLKGVKESLPHLPEDRLHIVASLIYKSLTGVPQ